MVPPPSLYLTLQPQIVEVGLLLAPVVRRSVRRLERDALLAGLRSHSVFRPTEFVGDQPCWCVALGELSQFAQVAPKPVLTVILRCLCHFAPLTHLRAQLLIVYGIINEHSWTSYSLKSSKT